MEREREGELEEGGREKRERERDWGIKEKGYRRDDEG